MRVIRIDGEIMNIVPQFTCRGSTALYRSFNQAARDVTSGGRTDARKTIVLFTDGMDTVDRSPAVCQSAAAQARAMGVRLFCVGLSMDLPPSLSKDRICKHWPTWWATAASLCS